jgi:hypothetical protein
MKSFMGIVNLLAVNVIIWQADTSPPRWRCLRCGWEAGDVPPGVESVAHLLAVRGGRIPMPSRSDVVGHRTTRGQETRGAQGT